MGLLNDDWYFALYLGVFHLHLSLRYLVQIDLHYSQTTRSFSSNSRKRNFYDLLNGKLSGFRKFIYFLILFTHTEEPVTGPGARDVDHKALQREKGCE